MLKLTDAMMTHDFVRRMHGNITLVVDGRTKGAGLEAERSDGNQREDDQVK